MYIQRETRLASLIKDKDVLDVGGGAGLHEFICAHSNRCVGIDICEKSVESLRNKGYEFILGDCQTIKLPEKYGKFDVVFAGELIEHLPNPGLFLENSRSWLKDDGLLIITTPNGRSLGKFIADFFGMWNEGWQHVISHNRSTIKHLLEFYDFEVIEIDFFTYEGFWKANRVVILKKIVRPFLELIFRLKPTLGHQMFIVARKRPKGTFTRSYNE